MYSKQQAKDLWLSPTIIINKEQLRRKAMYLGFTELIILAFKSLFFKN